MSEETLNNLFAKARLEAPETSNREVLGWIGGGTLMMLLAAWLIKFKIIFISKPLVMISSFITIAGITAGTIALIPSSGPQKARIATAETPHVKEKTIPVAKDSVPAEKPVAGEITTAPENIPPAQPTGVLAYILPALNPSNSYSATFCRNLIPEAPLNEEEEIGEFHALEVSGVANVVIIQDVKNDVWIEAKNAETDEVSVKNENGTLKISRRSSGRRNAGEAEKITVYVNLKGLDKIVCTDACSLTSQGGLEFESLRIESDGAPDLKLNLTVKNLDLDINGATNLDLWVMSEKVTIKAGGAADITLKGECADLNLVNEGAVELTADELKVEEATITASGVSHAKIFVTGRLDIEADGACKIKYKGSPEKGKITVAEAAHLGRF